MPESTGEIYVSPANGEIHVNRKLIAQVIDQTGEAGFTDGITERNVSSTLVDTIVSVHSISMTNGNLLALTQMRTPEIREYGAFAVVDVREGFKRAEVQYRLGLGDDRDAGVQRAVGAFSVVISHLNLLSSESPSDPVRLIVDDETK